MLFRGWCENERCVYFFSLIIYRASEMCEMNLWLKCLNKYIHHWDGLTTIAVSQVLGIHVNVCVAFFSFQMSVISLQWVFHEIPLYRDPSDIHVQSIHPLQSRRAHRYHWVPDKTHIKETPGGIRHTIMYNIWKYAVHIPLSTFIVPCENKVSRSMPGWCMCL